MIITQSAQKSPYFSIQAFVSICDIYTKCSESAAMRPQKKRRDMRRFCVSKDLLTRCAGCQEWRDGDAREARDGTAVTERSEVAPKTRIVCGEISTKERAFKPFLPTSILLYFCTFLAANGLPRYGQPEPPRRTVPVTFAQFPKKSRISVTDALPLSSSYTYRNA